MVALWIAFIFQYLWDTKQRMIAVWFKTYRCELLSFFSIFGIQNNGQKIQVVDESVVNCFHFSVSLGYKTTLWLNIDVLRLLWIAFIFQYLWDTKQPAQRQKMLSTRCELLSFFSIFGIQNNSSLENQAILLVVNCFHFSVSLGYKTTLLVFT